jgi:hypothetical protein
MHQSRILRTFASRAVFSPPHMSPEKMLGISLRLRAQTLRGFLQIKQIKMRRRA